MRHKSGIKAIAIEQEGEFVVLSGSMALKDTGYHMGNYANLKTDLVTKGVLIDNVQNYLFKESYSFRSPSAAAAVVLDRNSNGRQEWKVVGSKLTYHEWQEQRAGLST